MNGTEILLIIFLIYIVSIIVNYKITMACLMNTDNETGIEDSKAYRSSFFAFSAIPVFGSLMTCVILIVTLRDKWELSKKIKSFSNLLLFIPKKILEFVLFIIEIIPPNTRIKERK